MSLPQPSERTRADRPVIAAPGDRTAAFRALFVEHAGPLATFVFRYVGSRQVAEDVVQDVFYRLWLRWHDWSPRGDIRAYLYSAARNGALNALRQAGTEERWSREVGERLEGARQMAPGDSLRHADLAGDVRHAVAALPARQRMIVQLRWLHELSNADVATTLRISKKTVENQVNRALKTLRAILRRYEVDD
jgi:RNA polymerase sigma-70 factor, ECF subfamily